MSPTRPDRRRASARTLFATLSLSITLSVGGLLLAACAQQLSPQDVADRFWRAVVTGHPDKIRRYVRAADQSALKDASELLPVSSYRLGRAIIDGDIASIETHVTLDGDTPVPLKIETRLTLEDQQWRVDYSATVEEISSNGNLAQVISSIGMLGESLKHGIDQSIDEMNRALPALQQELSRIEAQIKQRIPELREKIEAFSERLEESLRAPPPETTPPPEQGTIAL